ncbi:hypothetical protein N0B40_09485 [Chryseobacterium oranimense]|uniref:hypothetical protein n=1 Tax=Chryseobacterium oranimense TaxID=421058 RepID=UPI0021AEB24D|nr:hypothetical protein [Chryseobacterium oranimense]UWX62508.1 hypothetical protein N0B40_09485 [Chryseobacterium oranimense]
MKYLPFERITYKTNLSEQEVLTRLSDFVEPKKFGLGRNPIKGYEGSVNSNSFEISRVIQYRNSFLPKINGIIQKNNYETEIQVTMKLDLFVLIFLIFWCSITASVFIMISLTEKKISIEFFMPLLMLVFVYIMTMLCFKFESKKSKEFLKKSFEAEIIKNS